ncbi:hypothetical protein D3C75_1117390 [compost metagenome]
MAQGAFGQQIQHGFQRAGERSLVHRRSDQQAIGVFYLLQQVNDLRAVEACMQQVFGREVPYLITHHLHALFLQPTLGAVQQHPGTGALTGTASE